MEDALQGPPDEPMTKDLIRYDLLVQDALKNVVRKVLGDAIRDGLPGDHHFYISFKTEYPGVRLSTRMREKYPQDMTIVLQHQFWDLSVTEHAIEVGLSFSGVPERLLIPFDALTGFFDPSVQFGLKFEIQELPAQMPNRNGGQVEAFRSMNDESDATPRDLARSRGPRGAASEPDEMQPKIAPAAKGEASKSEAGKTDTGKTDAGRSEVGRSEAGKSEVGKTGGKSRKAKSDDTAEKAGKSEANEDSPAASSADVVSLDSFRKKS
jgi:uncharacterized protein